MTYHLYNIPKLGDFEQDLEKITRAERGKNSLCDNFSYLKFERTVICSLGTAYSLNTAILTGLFLRDYNTATCENDTIYKVLLSVFFSAVCFGLNKSLSEQYKREKLRCINAKKYLASLEKKLNMQTTEI